MSRNLPSQPNLKFLKNEAKRLHRAHARGDYKVCDLFRHMLRFADESDADILAADVSLTDVQYALAMDYGYVSWQALKQAVTHYARIEDIDDEDVISTALSYLVERQFNEAVVVLDNALSLEPERIDILLLLSEIAAHRKDLQSFDYLYQQLERIGDKTALATATEFRQQLIVGRSDFRINLAAERRLTEEEREQARARRATRAEQKSREEKHRGSFNLLYDYYTGELNPLRFEVSNLYEQSIVALEISSTTIKLLEVAKNRSRLPRHDTFIVRNFVKTNLPGDAISMGHIDDADAVGEAIKNLLSQVKPATTHTAVSLSGISTMTKLIDMPATIPEEDREQWLEEREEEFIPLPRHEIAMEYEVLAQSENDPTSIKALLCACRLETIEQYVHGIEKGGLELRIVDLKSRAIQRVFDLCRRHFNGNVAIAEVGATMTAVYLITAEGDLHLHESQFGGLQLTQELQRRYELSFEEAERGKMEGGLPDDYETNVLNPFKAAMAQVIPNTLQLITAPLGDIDIDHILLAGGCAGLPDAADYIETKLGIPTSIADFTQLEDVAIADTVDAEALSRDAPAFFSLFGLAMRRR